MPSCYASCHPTAQFNQSQGAKGYHSYGKQVNDPEMKDMSGLGITCAALFVLQLMLAFFGGAIGASRAALDGVTLAA